MKALLRTIGILAGLGVLVVAVMFALLPWMDHWGATPDEIADSLTGDELVLSPRISYTRALTIHAAPREIYPWIVQLGAERGGMYSYAWFETNILRCELINADRIHAEWQNLKVGDQVKMCPGTGGPPPYEVAIIEQERAIVMGHKENGDWIEVWQFILAPQADGSTRLILRSRNAAQGWFWDVIRPGEFVMARGMLLGIKERSEGMTARPSTPTPEVFNPFDPSPSPSNSTLPLTCQVTDLNVYVNEEWGYCFAYPTHFTLDEGRSDQGIVTFYGPPLEQNTEPARASLEITTQVIPPESKLTPLVDAYLSSFQVSPLPIGREPWRLGDEPAEKLEPIPGLLSWQVVMAVHRNILFTLRFHPSDLEIAKADLEALTQTVTGSFAFLEQAAMPVSRIQVVSWFEFGKNISLSYDSILAPWVEARSVPPVPVSDQVLFAESQPAYAEFLFLAFQGGRAYDLPLLPLDNRMAQVRILKTGDFPGFGDDSPNGFINQRSALTAVLKTGVSPERCAQPLTSDPGLPFLPWINMKQTFCAQPQIIEFKNGKGIRYLSYYSQGPNPVLDQQVFYTFQGLTEDEQFYVAAFFPVQTGIFPTEPPPCPDCSKPEYDPFVELTAALAEQLPRLNGQAADEFAPSLTLLDELIESIQVGN